MVKTITILLAFTSTIIAIDPSCPAGFVSGYNGQTLDIVEPPATVWSLIGDFGNLTWAGISQVTLSDPAMNNVPPVWRTSVQGGRLINETLIIANGFDDNTMVGSETHTVAPLSLLPEYNTTISAYSDSVTVSPLCNGLATRMTFNVGYCTLPGFEPIVSDIFTQVHYGQLKNAQKILGAPKYNDSNCIILLARSLADDSLNGTLQNAPGIFRNGTAWNGTKDLPPASNHTTATSSMPSRPLTAGSYSSTATSPVTGGSSSIRMESVVLPCVWATVLIAMLTFV